MLWSVHREKETYPSTTPDTQQFHSVLPRIDNSNDLPEFWVPRLALRPVQSQAPQSSPLSCTTLAPPPPPQPRTLACGYSHLLLAELEEVLATEARGDKVATEGRDEGDGSHKSQQRADQIHQQRQGQLREGPHGDPPVAAAPPPTQLTGKPGTIPRCRQPAVRLPTRTGFQRQREQTPAWT